MLNNFLLELVFAVWIFLPAGIANMMPIAMAKLPLLKNWDYPMDFNKTYKGVRIFGDHKTIRGLISGIIMAIITVYLLQVLYSATPWLQSNLPIDYLKINPIIFGFLSGFGALLGDAVESFFKRRTNIKPGETWFPFDQTDYIIGGLLALALYIRFTPLQYVLIIFVYFGLHLATSYLGFLLKLKKSPI